MQASGTVDPPWSCRASICWGLGKREFASPDFGSGSGCEQRADTVTRRRGRGGKRASTVGARDAVACKQNELEKSRAGRPPDGKERIRKI